MPEIKRVLFVQRPEVIAGQKDQVERRLREALDAEVRFASAPGEVPPGARFDAVITPTLAWLPQLLRRLASVGWVHFLSAGVDSIWDMDYSWQGVALSKSSGVHAAPMSEYAIGAILYFAKQFDRFVAQSQQAIWQRTWLDELGGRELVVLGFGAVGRAVAQRAEAFGMNVSGVARTASQPGDREGVLCLADLPGLLPGADYVVVTLPLTSQTTGMLDDAFFAALRPGAVLVDMSRGGVVSGQALCAALESGRLRGAALDVFEREPLPADSPLWNRSNVLLTPHVAGTTPRYLERALDIFLQNAHAYRAGEGLVTAVEPGRGY